MIEKAPFNPDFSESQKLKEAARIKFEERAQELANELGVETETVLRTYAEIAGKQVDKNIGNEVIIQKIFTDNLVDDVFWENTRSEIEHRNTTKKLQDEISEKEGLLESEVLRRMKAEKSSLMDHLTGLPNRKYFESKKQELIDKFNQTKQPFSVIVLDIDDFKGINDHFGHPVGDDVLRVIGKAIKSCLRGTDFAARYGGEEIAVLVETNEEQAKRLANRISDAISTIDPRTVDIDPKIREKITASFGVAEFDPETEGIATQDVVNRADANMYQAKSERKRQQKAKSEH